MPQRACQTCGHGYTPTHPRQTHCPTHTPSHTGRNYQAETPSPSNTATHRPGWNAIRQRIITRDHGKPCPLCGHPLTPPIHIDHITPASHGGTNHPTNLRAVHRHCNLTRGATPPTTPTRGEATN